MKKLKKRNVTKTKRWFTILRNEGVTDSQAILRIVKSIENDEDDTSFQNANIKFECSIKDEEDGKNKKLEFVGDENSFEKKIINYIKNNLMSKVEEKIEKEYKGKIIEMTNDYEFEVKDKKLIADVGFVVEKENGDEPEKVKDVVELSMEEEADIDGEKVLIKIIL